MKKRILSIVVSVVLMTVFVTPVRAANDPEALKVYTDIMSYFESIKKGTWPLYYPDDVAGIFTEDNTIVILMVSPSEKRKEELSKQVEYPHLLVFRDAKYSYNELSKLAEVILNQKFTFNIVVANASQTENTVIVEVLEEYFNQAESYFNSKYKDKVKVVKSSGPEQFDDISPISVPSDEIINPPKTGDKITGYGFWVLGVAIILLLVSFRVRRRSY